MSTLVYAQLTVTSGREVGRRYMVRLGQTFVFGRSRKVAIRLRKDAMISREHAVIELRPQGLILTDLGSRNGTFVSGRRLDPHKPTEVEPGERIELGEHSFTVEILTGGEEDNDTDTRTYKLPPLPADEFRLLGLIGEGNSGRVFAAEQLLMRRRVAIKVLDPKYSEDSDQRERFLREGWICSQIQSPHVVDVYDLRIVRGQVCLIMELVQGPSALDRLRDGALPVRDVLRIGEDVSLALQAALEAGIIHRDIKPSNILLDPGGIAKLTDFGVAKSLLTHLDHEVTPLGEGLGTMAYVAPEQARAARDASLRSDIYGLGATLYHLLSGRPPFSPKDKQELYASLDADPPPLGEFKRGQAIPEQLVQLVHAMLSKEPDRRPYPPDILARQFHSLRLALYPDSGKHNLYETNEHSVMASEPDEHPTS